MFGGLSFCLDVSLGVLRWWSPSITAHEILKSVSCISEIFTGLKYSSIGTLDGKPLKSGKVSIPARSEASEMLRSK